jgi:hypothetical protein
MAGFGIDRIGLGAAALWSLRRHSAGAALAGLATQEQEGAAVENLEHQLMALLARRYVGEVRAVGADGLYLDLHGEPPAHKINDTYQIRAAIRELRRRGEPVCSGKAGYWWAESVEELERSCRRLDDRAKSSLAQAAAMRRVGKARLEGQLGPLWACES